MDALKGFRRKFNLSTSQLAELFDVPTRVVIDWEQGKLKMSKYAETLFTAFLKSSAKPSVVHEILVCDEGTMQDVKKYLLNS